MTRPWRGWHGRRDEVACLICEWWGFTSEDVTPSLRLFVALIVDVVGPGVETLLDCMELRGIDTVGSNLCQADAVCSAQTLCKESYVEACVAFLKELDEARIADRSGGADRIDVEIVAGGSSWSTGRSVCCRRRPQCQERGQRRGEQVCGRASR